MASWEGGGTGTPSRRSFECMHAEDRGPPDTAQRLQWRAARHAGGTAEGHDGVAGDQAAAAEVQAAMDKLQQEVRWCGRLPALPVVWGARDGGG